MYIITVYMMMTIVLLNHSIYDIIHCVQYNPYSVYI